MLSYNLLTFLMIIFFAKSFYKVSFKRSNKLNKFSSLKLESKIDKYVEVGPRKALSDLFQSAIISTFGSDFKDQDPMVAPSSKSEFGDYQCNVAMLLAKKTNMKPQDIAKRIIDAIDVNGIVQENSLAIAGPGFINIKLDENLVKKKLIEMFKDPQRLNVVPYKIPKKIVVDFSSPNIAKEMHVGHLRSTIIGDSISKILEFLGNDILRINHVGDWGTQFGMLIRYLKENHPDYFKLCIEKNELLTEDDAMAKVPIKDLVEFYKSAKKRFDEDKEFEEASRLEVVKLQNGDPQSLRAWKAICEVSRVEFNKIYELLDIKILERGESFYNPMLKSIVEELEASGLAVPSDGAVCIFLPGYKNGDGSPMPLIIKKSDGGYLYATTDLAAVRQRVHDEKADRVLYITDIGQSQHFEMVFKAAEASKLFQPDKVQLKHVPFGLVQGEDGKKFKSRSGETVKLKDLLDEAIRIAGEDLKLRRNSQEGIENSDLTQEEANAAKIIGIGAVKYADLSMNRESNYRFSYKKMLSLSGNTAPYMLYAYARIQGIRRKVSESSSLNININNVLKETDSSKLVFLKDEEVILAKTLLKLDDILREIEQDLYPNKLCEYIFDLSQKFNQFYENCPVINAESEASLISRYILCSTTADTLKLSLSLLGIDCLEKL